MRRLKVNYQAGDSIQPSTSRQTNIYLFMRWHEHHYYRTWNIRCNVITCFASFGSKLVRILIEVVLWSSADVAFTSRTHDSRTKVSLSLSNTPKCGLWIVTRFHICITSNKMHICISFFLPSSRTWPIVTWWSCYFELLAGVLECFCGFFNTCNLLATEPKTHLVNESESARY